MKLVKLMFLASNEQKLYDFVPYQYGPFSFQLYQDMRHLERYSFLSQINEEVNFLGQVFPKPDAGVQKTINLCVNQFGDYLEKDLIDYVYQKYPEMTIFSTIKRLKSYCRDETGIATVGYEGKNIDKFLMLLIENKIGKLIDVRKNAFSMKYGFSKNQLSGALNKLGISYLHFPELGIDSAKRNNLNQKGYADLFNNYALELSEKEAILNNIKSLAQNEKVALMCFEAKASDCHRNVIAQRFRDEGLVVVNL
jgi:uncharacterized protein (DUF488 family)